MLNLFTIQFTEVDLCEQLWWIVQLQTSTNFKLIQTPNKLQYDRIIIRFNLFVVVFTQFKVYYSP